MCTHSWGWQLAACQPNTRCTAEQWGPQQWGSNVGSMNSVSCAGREGWLHSPLAAKAGWSVGHVAGAAAAAAAATPPSLPPLLPCRARCHAATSAFQACCHSSCALMRATASITEAVKDSRDRMARGGLRSTLSRELLQRTQQGGAAHSRGGQRRSTSQCYWQTDGGS